MPDITLASSDEEIDAFLARGKDLPNPRGVAAVVYDREADTLNLRYTDGIEMRIPRRLLQGLAAAEPDAVAEIAIEGVGTMLWWPRLEVGHHTDDLAQGLVGSPRWMESVGLHPRAA